MPAGATAGPLPLRLADCAHPAARRPRIGRAAQVSYQGAVLHHYISRSLADFAVKQGRRDGTGNVKQVGRLPLDALLRRACCLPV